MVFFKKDHHDLLIFLYRGGKGESRLSNFARILLEILLLIQRPKRWGLLQENSVLEHLSLIQCQTIRLGICFLLYEGYLHTTKEEITNKVITPHIENLSCPYKMHQRHPPSFTAISHLQAFLWGTYSCVCLLSMIVWWSWEKTPNIVK